MESAIVIGYFLSAALPLLGLVRLYLIATGEATTMNGAVPPSSGTGISVDQMQKGTELMVRAIQRRPRAVTWDFVFIGAGVVFGALASIASVLWL